MRCRERIAREAPHAASQNRYTRRLIDGIAEADSEAELQVLMELA